MKEETKRLGWGEADLQTRRKGDLQKGKLPRRLREETTLSLRWIAQRLQMGSGSCVFNLLNQNSQTPNGCK